MKARFGEQIPGATVRLAALLFFAGCVALPVLLPEPQVTSLLSVPPEKTIIVGRIELHPPLQEKEQVLKTWRGKEFRDVFILYAGDRLRDFKTSKPSTFEGSYSIPLGKEFFIKAGKGMTFIISGGMFYTEYDPPYRVVPQTFSSPLQVELRPDDEAVYIGTIQYYRDEANQVKAVMIRDDYQWAESQFKEQFGGSKTLRKALLAPVPRAK